MKFQLLSLCLCTLLVGTVAFANGGPTSLDLKEWSGRVESELSGNILPFWIREVAKGDSGFVPELAEDLRPNPSQPRGPLLSARILWTYAHAYRRSQDPAHLAMARRAYDDMERLFWDAKDGGYLWMADPSGRIINDTKQIYGQSFAIYALAEYSLVTGEKAPLARAMELFRLVERHSRDRVHGGYLEAFTRDWRRPEGRKLSAIGPEFPKSQNTHLHLMEAYTTLLRAQPDAEVREALRSIVELMLTRVLTPDGRHLNLYFHEDWSPASTRVSYGHDIEANWLMTEAAEALGDQALLARVHRAVLVLAETTLAEGMDSDGGIYNEGTPKGADDMDKEWWQQAEAVVGFLNSYQISGDARYYAAARRVWNFIELRIADHRSGEWHRAVTREGELKSQLAKVSFWKCPYHNGRACMETIDRLKALGTGK
jgi:mannobiose 2-epimerase